MIAVPPGAPAAWAVWINAERITERSCYMFKTPFRLRLLPCSLLFLCCSWTSGGVAGAHPKHVMYAHPQDRGPFQQRRLIVCSPADSRSTLGLWRLIQMPVWCQALQTSCQTNSTSKCVCIHQTSARHPSSSLSGDPVRLRTPCWVIAPTQVFNSHVWTTFITHTVKPLRTKPLMADSQTEAHLTAAHTY